MASEYNTAAHSAKEHWEKTMSYQRSLSHQLQENFEALAKQMHGLESEARRASKQGMSIGRSELDESYLFPGNGPPMIDSISLASSIPDSAHNGASPILTNGTKPPAPGGAQRLNKTTKKEVSFKIPSTDNLSGPPILVTGNGGRNMSPDDQERETSPDDEEEDDQFYDAEEGGDLPDSDHLLAIKKSLHKRTASSISMNESLMGSLVPSSVPLENLPTSGVGGTITVRVGYSMGWAGP